MTSPATMRLVGLLVIVGVVAGCGVDEDMTPDSQTESVAAALRMDDVVALREKTKAHFAELYAVITRLDGPDTRTVGQMVSGMNPRPSDEISLARLFAEKRLRDLERAVQHGDVDEARVFEAELRDVLEAARRFVSDFRLQKVEKK